MRRSALLLLVAVLSTVTGTALIGAGLVLVRPATGSSTATTTIGPVSAYVAAVNQLLRTGDATALDAVVADDFVDHGPSAVFGSDRAGLTRHVRVLRASYPDLAFSLDDALSSGSRVSVRLTAKGQRARTFLGTPMPDGRSTWTTWELFRVERGQVVERWATDLGVDLYQPLTAQPGDLRIDHAVVVAVARLRPVREMVVPAVLPGAAVVAVEDGEVRVRSDRAWHIGRDGSGVVSTVPAGVEVALRPADVASLPAGTATVHASDARSSFVVVVALPATPDDDTERWARAQGDAAAPGSDLLAAFLQPEVTGPTIGAGLLVDRLARIRPPATMDDVVRVDLGRIVLRPGAGVQLPPIAGARGIAVEAGEIELAPMDGRLEIQQSPREGGIASSLRIGEPVALTSGDAAIIPSDHDADVRNTADVPIAIVIAVLAPSEGSTTLPTPTQVAIASPTPFSDAGAGSTRGRPS